MTGAELIAALEATAAARGIKPGASGINAYRRAEIARCAHPTPRTVARIEAFIAGRAVPSARDYQRASIFTGEHPGPPVPAEPVERDPCFRCGTRADLGCRHRRADWQPVQLRRPVHPIPHRAGEPAR